MRQSFSEFFRRSIVFMVLLTIAIILMFTSSNGYVWFAVIGVPSLVMITIEFFFGNQGITDISVLYPKFDPKGPHKILQKNSPIVLPSKDKLQAVVGRLTM